MKQAVLDFQQKYAIDEEIVLIDQTPNVYPSVYWNKNKDVL